VFEEVMIECGKLGVEGKTFIGDVGCTLVSRLIKILLTDHASLADKGFTLHTQFAALYHYLLKHKVTV
jgi:hypothetical protein